MESEVTTNPATPARQARAVPPAAAEVANKGGRPAPDAWRKKNYPVELRLLREIAQQQAGIESAKRHLEELGRSLHEAKASAARIEYLRGRVPRWHFERAFGDKALGEKLLTDAVRARPNYAEKKAVLDKLIADQLAAITADTIGFDLPAGE